ncbi:MAG: heparinase II/III domain-containing protein [Armatimonadota bacterium]|jgi:hypothetical protein
MRPRTALTAALMIGAFMTVGHAKDAATFYTPERVAMARENVERYEWAQEELGQILDGQPQTYVIGRKYTSARDYAAQSDDFIWELQPSTTIPRIFPNEARAECPVHGTEVRRYNAWHPWRIDPINHPWQIMCMMGEEWYPSNDFGAGDMTSGDFPDDGGGYLAPDGRRFYFIREYAHACYTAVTIPTLNALSRAWLLTGDRAYARKAAILLARLASEYPNHDDRQDRLWAAPYGGRHPHYEWKGGGMITDLIWETFCTEDAVLAYDAVYEYLGDDPDLIDFLKEKGMPIDSADGLREYIEHYLLRAAAVALQNGAIKGNEGHHQALAMTIALVLDDYSANRPNSRDMVDYAYHGTGHCAYIMPNFLRRDGGGHESPNYNRIKTDFIRVARLMEEIRAVHPDQFGFERYPDIFGGDRARAMFDWFIDCKMLGYYTPSIGDNGGIRAPRRVAPQDYSYVGRHNVYAFEKFGDPRYARASTRADGSLFRGELFWAYPGEELKAALRDPASEMVVRSRLLDGYGAAILESGEGDHRRAVCLNYATTVGHRQQDNLNLEVFARGVDILPDLGYPFTWDYRWEWDANIMAHNTVSVGESHADTRRRLGNACSLFASEDGVHVVVASHDPYPEGYGHTKNAAPDVDLYERTVLLVDIDPERFYVLDLFAVRGGDQHDQSWHGPLVTPEDPELEWVAQPSGTLAGPEVEQFAEYTDRWGRTWTSFPSFVKDVRRATLAEPATWHWDYGLDAGDRLNLHLLPVGGPMQVIRCAGRSPARPDDWKLDYLVARRLVASGERSLFATIIDAYQGAPVVHKAWIASEAPLQIKVQYEGGIDLITIATPPGPSRTTAHRAHGVRVVSRQGDAVTRDVRVGAVGPDPGYLTGKIASLDYDDRTVEIAYTDGAEELFAPGRAVRIFNQYRTSMFRIEGVESDGDLLRLTLDTTALLARGPVAEVRDGWLDVDAYFVYSTGHADEETGALTSSRHLYFRGARLGEGAEACALRGTARLSAEQTRIYVEGGLTADELTRRFGGETVSVWEYGVGDAVELAVVR